MKAKKYFITGTDTEVGKTYILSLICKRFVRLGKRVGVFKPVESGLKNNPSPDFKLLAKAADDKEKPLYVFKEPLAPLIASSVENVKIDKSKILSFINKDLDENNYDIYFIEGAGGLFVPLSEKTMIIDLIKSLDYEVILVARAGLGTVNHTLLSIEALKSRGIKIKSIILNEVIETSRKQIKNNAKMIEDFGNIKVNAIVYKNDNSIEIDL